MENKDILIEQYLEGTLTGAALEAFQQQLQTDQELQLTLALQRQGRALLGEKGIPKEDAFLQILSAQTAKHFAPETPMETNKPASDAKRRRVIALRRFSIAAVGLLVLFAGLKWYAVRYYQTPAILAHYYTPASTPATLSGNTYGLREAYTAYRNKQYESALRSFGAVPAGDPQYAEALLFSGYAYYESGQYAQAVSAFGRVIQTGDVRFVHNAEWHRLLAALAENPNSDQAKGYLKAIQSDASHPFNQEANSLARELKSPFRNLAG